MVDRSVSFLVAHVALGFCCEEDKLEGPLGLSRESHQQRLYTTSINVGSWGGRQACRGSFVDEE